MVEPRLIQAVDDLIRRHERPGHVPLIAIAGAQGSGKSTLAAEAAMTLGCATLSLDDVYLTPRERGVLATNIHPLFATRGPPGTHDLGLLTATLDALPAAGPDAGTPLPTFDKLRDERWPAQQWLAFQGRPRAILLEGWCLGATPQRPEELVTPVNAMERDRDPDGVWRRAVNAHLAGEYAALFASFDALLFLRAPGFGPVLDWRLEQEAGLAGIDIADLPSGRRDELAIFIQTFERLTRYMMSGGVKADVVVELDEARAVRHIGPCDGA